MNHVLFLDTNSIRYLVSVIGYKGEKPLWMKKETQWGEGRASQHPAASKGLSQAP